MSDTYEELYQKLKDAIEREDQAAAFQATEEIRQFYQQTQTKGDPNARN